IEYAQLLLRGHDQCGHAGRETRIRRHPQAKQPQGHPDAESPLEVSCLEVPVPARFESRSPKSEFLLENSVLGFGISFGFRTSDFRFGPDSAIPKKNFQKLLAQFRDSAIFAPRSSERLPKRQAKPAAEKRK